MGMLLKRTEFTAASAIGALSVDGVCECLTTECALAFNA